jgi:hypothetical protein
LPEWPAATTGGPFGLAGLPALPRICARASVMLNGIHDNAQEEAHDD